MAATIDKKKKIIFDKEELRNGLLIVFNKFCGHGSLDVFLVLSAFSKDDKTCSASVKELCKSTGYSTSKVLRILSKLEVKNLIKKLKKHCPGVTQVYQISKVKR